MSGAVNRHGRQPGLSPSLELQEGTEVLDDEGSEEGLKSKDSLHY